ncbi:ATP-NAD kinase [Dendrothele bispora CBS 962.96]|uniref:ATP-NAD kinase n=1 Tax=Dendrothele bispora (strain CBS 962.96) TaxID=1314807 RepID=A0A4S8MUA1_DENBC|nr:ATP-NAD kinase [Dendrothele bispora CBS 962.96]
MPQRTPETETFSTPPTTPGVLDTSIRPSLSRRSSRPSSLHLDAQSDWNPGIVVEEASPVLLKKLATGPTLSPNSQEHTITPTSSIPSHSALPNSLVNGHHRRQLDSPCFVHSQLDKGASLTEWLRSKNEDVGITGSLNRNSEYSPPTTVSSTSGSEISIDDDDYGASLTKQLAETAVGVRELSKQLGRARIRSNIQNILIITKARDNRLIKLTRQLALYLMLKPRHGQKRGLVVYVDNQLRTSRRFDAEGIERDHPELFVPFPRRRTSSSNSLSSMQSAQKEDFYLKEEGQLRYWTSSMCSQSPHLFDFVITLGGDGTVLFTSWLFQRIVPPVLSFALGSLGFLTNFDFADHQAVMDSAIDSGIRVNLRMRFTCTVYRAVANEVKGRKAVKKGETGEIMMRNVEQGGWEALEGGWSGGPGVEGGKACRDKEIMCFTTRPVETFEVLNDLVVDRGPSPYVSLLELFGDEHHMTTVQADGLTVSTPTGSTAYSLSAGGSLVHPEIPALLITPICPHTLSFRPMLLPDSMELRICVPYNSRSTAWASFDGRGRVELKQGDHIKVTASKYPFPTVCADKQSTDWFHAISRTLKWNERERQKSFVVVEEGPEGAEKKKKKKLSKSTSPLPTEEETIEDEEEDEVSDEEEDKFDIDDSSPEAAAANNSMTDRDQQLGQEKTKEVIAEEQIHKSLAETAARRRSKSRSRSRNRSGTRSGIDSPSRFAGPEPHLSPVLSPRRVGFDLSVSESSDSEYVEAGRNGMRDDLRTSRKVSGKSRIPKDRDPSELDNVKTPTVGTLPFVHGRTHARSRSGEYVPHRAFAVWGQDESDSNASDSDA